MENTESALALAFILLKRMLKKLMQPIEPKSIPKIRKVNQVAREMPNGTLVYPMRGEQIVCPAGYELVPGETHQCWPILIDCEHREIREHIQPCGRKINILYCKKNLLTINRGICKLCKEKGNDV